MDTRRGEREQPANIGRRNKMPGRTHRVGAQYGTVSKGLINGFLTQTIGALGNDPCCARILLGLYRAKPLHHFVGPSKRCSDQVLVL